MAKMPTDGCKTLLRPYLILCLRETFLINRMAKDPLLYLVVTEDDVVC